MRTLALLLAVLASAAAQAESPALPTPRYPTESCGAHLANTQDPLQRTTMGSYVRGFLSGMNQFRTDGKLARSVLDDGSISILLERRCRTNLLMKVDEAVVQVAQELAQ